MVKVSDHGGKRIRSRCGIPKKSVGKVAQAAFRDGITHSEATGSLKRYMDKIFFKAGTANNNRIYKNKVWIFSGHTLITVLDLPPKYINVVAKILKRRQQPNESEAINS